MVIRTSKTSCILFKFRRFLLKEYINFGPLTAITGLYPLRSIILFRMRQSESAENLSISTKIPSSLQVLVERAVMGGHYLNISNFVREAIAEKLQREGYFRKTANFNPEAV